MLQDYVTPLPAALIGTLHVAFLMALAALFRATPLPVPGWRVVGPGGAHWFCFLGSWAFATLASWVWLFVGSARRDAETQMGYALILIFAFGIGAVASGFYMVRLRRMALRWRGTAIRWREGGRDIAQDMGDLDGWRHALSGLFHPRFRDGTILKLDLHARNAQDLAVAINERADFDILQSVGRAAAPPPGGPTETVRSSVLRPGAAMRRRDFLWLLGGAAAVWPHRVLAQSGRRRIAILSISSPQFDAANVAAFRDGLRQLGHIEGRTIDIDYRASNGDAKILDELARELLGLRPQVVMATSVTSTRMMNRIAPSMPIVCPGFSDSFVPSLATSFAHPGGSITGVASDVEALLGKLAELAIDAIPGMTRLGFLSNPAGGSMPRFVQQVRSVTKAHGIELVIAPAETAEAIPGALRQLKDNNVQAVIVPTNGLLNASLKQIVEVGTALRLPLIFGRREGALSGGLASHGINVAENYRRSAAYVDKILKGALPGDLPIEFPTRIDLIVNLKTAKALGLTLPNILLDRANDVIE